MLCSDEAYSEIYFTDEPPISALNVSIENVLAFFSMSKRSMMTGWRVGWVAGDEQAVQTFRTMKTNLDSGTPNFIQVGAIAALNDETHVENMREITKRKREILCDALVAQGLEDCRPDASLYVWQKTPDGLNSIEFAKLLLKPEFGIVCTPGQLISQPDATGYNFEIAFPSDATISIALPFFVTSFVVNPELAAELPDGEYRWRVQAVFGDENGGWADWFTFSKDSRHGPPMDCQGFVTSVNVDDGLLRVESAVWRREADGPGAWGCWMVHVTDDTVITKDGANISLADVAIGDYVYVEGWAANMGEGVPPCMDMVAGRIEVTDYSPPSFVSGSVAEIMPEERSFWLSEMTYDAKGPLERVLVRLTDNANLTRKGMPISFEDVRVGDFAVASGTWQRAVDGDDYFLASSVDFSFGNADWVYFEGTIERINHDDSTIVLSGTHSWGPRVLLQGRIVVSITRSTVISRNGLPAGFNDLMVGDSAFVEGRLMMQDQRPIPHDNELDPKVEASSIDAYSSRPNSN